MATKPVHVDLTWLGELRFSATVDEGTTFTMDSAGAAGPSPVQALAAALAGCMGIDLALILARGRHPLTALRARLVADRAETDPKRMTAVALHYTIEGAVPRDAVERAIALSHDKYCSVWHSMRQDIDFRITFDITGG